MGGDINGGWYQGPVTEAQVKSPSQFIAYGEVPSVENVALISFNANLDPTTTAFGHLVAVWRFGMRSLGT